MHYFFHLVLIVHGKCALFGQSCFFFLVFIDKYELKHFKKPYNDIYYYTNIMHHYLGYKESP